jgi:uncharacterized iron-regulated protein
MRALVAVVAAATLSGCMPARTAADIPGTTLLTSGGSERSVDADALLRRADDSAAVCVGEQHDEAKHHEVQRRLLEALIAHSRRRGVRLALGMEMFRRQMQPALNAYFSGEIDASTLADVTNWNKSWGFDFAMYRPLLETAREHRVRIIGLNAHRALTQAVARRGLDSLPKPVRDSLPQLVLDDAAHRKFFWAIMGFDAPRKEGHGHGHGMNREYFYAAQVIWDETMAEGVTSWLSDPEPRQMLVVAGNGHCHRSAIPSRVTRRLRRPVLSVLVRTQGEELPAFATSDFVIEVSK